MIKQLVTHLLRSECTVVNHKKNVVSLPLTCVMMKLEKRRIIYSQWLHVTKNPKCGSTSNTGLQCLLLNVDRWGFYECLHLHFRATHSYESLRSGSRFPIWPEWNEAEISKEKWDSSSNKSHNAVNLLYEMQHIAYITLQIYFRSGKFYFAFVCSHILKIPRGKFPCLHCWECTRGSVLQTLLSTRYISSF